MTYLYVHSNFSPNMFMCMTLNDPHNSCHNEIGEVVFILISKLLSLRDLDEVITVLEPGVHVIFHFY